jgi:hypothetical protein
MITAALNGVGSYWRKVVAHVENNTATVAFAEFVPTWLAIADQKVNALAGTQGDSRGQVCPSTGGSTGFGAQPIQSVEQSPSQQSLGSQSARTLSARIRVARYGSAIRSLTVMDSVQVSKPRTGYHATSGTG